MSTEAKALVEAVVAVRWGDMDAFGHVNNSVYATFVEEARLQWFESIEGGWHDAQVAPVVASQRIDYRQPIEWPAVVVVELACERVGTSSLTLGFRIVSREMPQKFYADGTTVLVWIDRESGRSTPLPASVRRAAGADDA